MHELSLPAPPTNGISFGPLVVHFYALMYILGIGLAMVIARRRWRVRGGRPELVYEVALWGVPAGIIGGRIYFDVTTPAGIPHHWWGVLAVWDGGLGIWGGVALAAAVGIWRVRRRGAAVERVIVDLKRQMRLAGTIDRYAKPEERLLAESVIRWCIQRYFGRAD